eukprot:TRINITY_DN273_c0_g1_i4.p1 TRINITY_DN273_c0_g1~~TRINITY_DN273_c0_g1_i4.p1  ORF type:complete len:226 (+),score=19.40 TRINITY_DN273_c0_g1_i4:80-757(+)
MAAAAPFENWYRSLPIVTKSFMTACVLTTLAIHLDLVHPLSLYLNYYVIVHNLEVWRVVTNFLFFDELGLNFIFHMFFLVRYSKLLEEGSYRGRTADYLFLWMFGAVWLLAITSVFYYTKLPLKIMFLGPSLSFVILYVWSRRNIHVRMSFLGLFTFTAPYLPWVILGFGVMLGQDPVGDLVGMAVGHVYYFLEDVYPSITNRRLLRTPTFFKTLIDGPVAVNQD